MSASKMAKCLVVLTCTFSLQSFAEMPKELEAYKKIAGSYKCKGQTKGEGAHAFDATFKLEPVLGGAAYLENYQEKKSKAHASPGGASVLWGYDKDAGKYSRHGVDPTGAWGSATSTGFDDKGIFTWDLAGGTTKIAISAKGGAVDFDILVAQKDSTWLSVAEVKCKK